MDKHGMNVEDLIAAQKITMSDIVDHLTGPVVSLIVHIVLLALLGTMIVFEVPKQYTEIPVEMREVDIIELDPNVEIPEPPDPIEIEVNIEIDIPDMMEIEMSEVVIDETQTIENVTVDISIPDISMLKEHNSMLVIDMPAGFGMRTGDGKEQSLKRYGGPNVPKITKSTEAGLNWLANAQNEDGSWGTNTVSNRHKAALSGLATLAFLAHGEVPSSPKYGPVVLKAIQRLIQIAPTVRNDSYSHAIVIYALAEAYGLTNIPMAGREMDIGIKRIIEGLNEYGSFDYGYSLQLKGDAPNQKQRSDLSVAGWNYQAMKAAFSAGSKIEELPDAIQKSIDIGLKKTHYVNSGGFSYGDGGSANINMSSIGTLCLQLFGEGKSIQARRGMQFINDSSNGRWLKCDWKNSGGWPLYRWYYQTQAIFQHTEGRGRNWTSWNNEFSSALIREQESNGSWTSPLQKYGDAKAKEGGHRETIAGFHSDKDLRIWSTSLCTLMLTVYYRLLPTFQVVQTNKSTTNAISILADDLGLILE